MLLRLGPEAQTINDLHDLPQVVATLNLIFDLAEDLTDLVLDGVGTSSTALEA